MKIAFVDTSDMRYTPHSPFEQPLGGTQSAACYLSRALAARGHQTTIFNANGNGDHVDGVRCVRFDEKDSAALNDHDAVVVLSEPIGRKLRNQGVRTALVLWQHSATSHSQMPGLTEDGEKAAWNGFVFVSDYQRKTFVERWGVNGKVLRNAMSPMMIEKKREYKNFIERNEDPVLVYASAPGRGLDNILIAFPTIRKRLPGARLKIFSSQTMYQVDASIDGFGTYYELARNLVGVEYVGGVSQARLADELTRCDIWAYPTAFEETSCIVMMEAAAAGCLLLASDVGALEETGGAYARRVRLPSSRAILCARYARALCDEVDRLRRDPEKAARFFESQSAWFRSTYNWANRAAEWEAWLADEVLAR
jgi:glycosyltransferase involved in cell wall biosynthesis